MSTKYNKELLEEAVKNSYSYAGVLRFLELKQAGGTQSYIASRIKQFQIDTTHFKSQAWNKGSISKLRKNNSEILIVLPEGSLRPKVYQLRRCLLDFGVAEECVLCGLSDEWNGHRIQLEIDHIDGNWLDNRIENLRYLCPNCHSQQATSRSWKHANKGEK